MEKHQEWMAPAITAGLGAAALIGNKWARGFCTATLIFHILIDYLRPRIYAEVTFSLSARFTNEALWYSRVSRPFGQPLERGNWAGLRVVGTPRVRRTWRGSMPQQLPKELCLPRSLLQGRREATFCYRGDMVHVNLTGPSLASIGQEVGTLIRRVVGQ